METLTEKAEKLNFSDQLEEFFEINLDLLCIADVNGVFRKLNKSWEESLGYRVEELEGKVFLDYVHPEDLASTLEALGRLRNKEKVLNFTNRYRCKDGSYRYIEWRSHLYGDFIYAAARDITERKTIEDSLRESEENFRTFFETIDDVVVVGNLQGDLIYANSAAVKDLGYTLGELKKMKIIELNDESRREEAELIFSQMLSGQRNTCPIPLQAKDGGLIPVETKVWMGEWNGEKAIFGLAKDLSAQQAAYDRFYRLFDNNPALMAISSVEDRKITDVNAAFLENLGYEKDEVIGKTGAELNLFAEQQDWEAMAEILRNGEGIKQREVKLRKKNGELLDGIFSGDVIKNQMEKSFLAVMMDVTESKKAQAEIKEKSGLILSLIESIPDIVFYKDVEGVYMGCNPKFEKLVGKSRDQIIGFTDHDLFEPQMAALYRKQDEEVLAGKSLWRDEEWFTYANEKNCLLDILKTPYWGEDGTLIGLIGIGRDITDRRKKEEQIEYLSFHDQLTGLYNRRFYEEELKRLDTEENYPLTIAMGDANGLKFVNDAFGHEMGDQLLWKVGVALKKACRDEDLVARVGGDEFVLVLPRTDLLAAEKIVKRIKQLLQKEKVGALAISVSFGTASKTKGTEDMQQVFKDCEDRMYRNKLWERASLRSKSIDIVLNALYEKDHREMLHSKKVASICEMIAKEMDLDPEGVHQIRLAGLLHDIGKIIMGDSLLIRRGPLSEGDWQEIRKHPETGYRILSAANEFAEIAPGVHEHHERWDGTGYPKGLCGEEISLAARIISVADAYDAMTGLRGYKKVFSKEEAKKELRDCSGTQFDPEVVHTFLEKVISCQEI